MLSIFACRILPILLHIACCSSNYSDDTDNKYANNDSDDRFGTFKDNDEEFTSVERTHTTHTEKITTNRRSRSAKKLDLGAASGLGKDDSVVNIGVFISSHFNGFVHHTFDSMPIRLAINSIITMINVNCSRIKCFSMSFAIAFRWPSLRVKVPFTFLSVDERNWIISLKSTT